MQLLKNINTVKGLQWLSWVVVCMMMFFSMLPMDGPLQSAIWACLNTSFYVLLIYANIFFLYPRLYAKGRVTWYVLSITVFFVAAGLGRGWLLTWIYNKWFATTPEVPHGYTWVNYLAGLPLILVMSFLVKMALDYFTLKRQTAALLLQNTQTELHLLKSQVQPHFLFNTLNNIYYEAYREAPQTALLIERLSEIMRYFVDESPKDAVHLTTEVNFLEHYIALEQIRMRHGLTLQFTKQVEDGCHIPPMLLMTFVENIFKHGIDKTSRDNRVDISLVQKEGRLIFTTVNTLPEHSTGGQTRGSGIANLRKRLQLLYGEDYTLQTTTADHYFTAFLSVPV